MAAELSCLVQNFVVIYSLEFGWENDISLNVNYKGKIRCEMASSSGFALTHGQVMLYGTAFSKLNS